MKIDSALQRGVLNELGWQPSIDGSRIGGTADAGVVRLTGHVASDPQRNAAEDAVKRVRGVAAVVNDLEFSAAGLKRDDRDIAREAACALQWDILVPDDKIAAASTTAASSSKGSSSGKTRKRLPRRPFATRLE